MVSTIGGTLPGPAAHIHWYGVTTNHVMALEVVLPDAEVYEIGTAAGDFAGYDLVGAFVGSEGTFGTVTKATVRLLYSPPAVKTMLAVYDSVADATRTVSGIIARGIVPAALEMIDKNTIQAIEASVYATGIPKDAEAVLLIEVDGLEAGIEQQMERVAEVIRANNARRSALRRTTQSAKALGGPQKPPLGRTEGSRKYYTMDGVIPRSKLPGAGGHRCAGPQIRPGSECATRATQPSSHHLYDARQRMPNKVFAWPNILRRCVEVGGALSETALAWRSEFMALFSEELDVMQRLEDSSILRIWRIPARSFQCGAGVARCRRTSWTQRTRNTKRLMK
jgi:glycolate oxidase